jgi:hypothetical protein
MPAQDEARPHGCRGGRKKPSRRKGIAIAGDGYSNRAMIGIGKFLTPYNSQIVKQKT